MGCRTWQVLCVLTALADRRMQGGTEFRQCAVDTAAAAADEVW
jgi:hypothetical protein